MRIIPLLMACLVAAFLFAMVFQRDALLAFARDLTPASDAVEAPNSEVADVMQTAAADQAPASKGDDVISVVGFRSVAQNIDSAVRVRGQTQAARQVDLRAETSGQVISEPRPKGTLVSAGDLMCRLDPGTRAASLAEAEARLAEARARIPETKARVVEAEARLQEALINSNAAKKLSQDGFASDTRVAQTDAAEQAARAGVAAATSGLQSSQASIQAAQAAVASARKEIERLEIHASFDGSLESDTAELGALLQPGALCATVIQLDPIKLVGFVPETDVDRVTVGSIAQGRLVSGRDVSGQVTFLSRSADPTTRTFRVEVEIPNPDLTLRDGQTADIVIESEGTMAHLLPASALTLDDQGRLGVRVVQQGKAQFVEVKQIRDTPQGVFLDGLPPEVTVIVVGQEFVIDGVPVNVVLREMPQ